MEFNYIATQDKNGFVKNLFKLSFVNDDTPFSTIIIPVGFTSFAYLFNDGQTSFLGDKEIKLKGLIITGQCYGAYNYFVNKSGLTYGIELHPTALYKIFNTDISKFTNKHTAFKEINEDLDCSFSKIFLETKNDEKAFANKITSFLDNINPFIDSDVIQIDKAIDYIFEKQGMLQISDLLNLVPFSQKSLETKFKKIIGLTPGKYIRMIRFSELMRKYESKKIDMNDLIVMYNYYDKSHFFKDFKLFLSQNPRNYFKMEYPLLKKYLK